VHDFGRVEIKPLPALKADRHPAASYIANRQLYRWLPPKDLAEQLPKHYSVALESWLCHDGVRRFSPADPNEVNFREYKVYDSMAFVLLSSAGGRALLSRDGARFPWLTLGEATLFMQYGMHLREYLGPTRQLGNSLHLCATARQTLGEKDALPADIGLDETGSGERWTVVRVKKEGLAAAEDRKLESPSENDIVRLGLLAAAEANPLDISDAEAEFITRAVLFRIDTALPQPSNDDIEFVAQHIRKSIDRKKDVSNDEFRKWIHDRNSSLIRSIQRSSGNKLERPQIRSAILELAWHSIKMIGAATDRVMRNFCALFPEPLTTTEAALYEQCYLANPVFGGMPLILLQDRFSFISEIVPDLWAEPSDQQKVRIMRTMLYYYGVIVGNLRDSDSLYKRRAKVRDLELGPASSTDIYQDTVSSTLTPLNELFHDVARKVAIDTGIIRGDIADDCMFEIISLEKDTVHIAITHSESGTVQPMLISRKDLESEVSQWRDG